MPQDTFDDIIRGTLTQSRSILLIALGSNTQWGAKSPHQTICAGVERIRSAGGMIHAQSRFFNTPAYPPGSGPQFVNAALVVSACWTTAQALENLHAIEAELGRVRQDRWGQRTIDLDLLAHGDRVCPDANTLRRWMNLPLELQKKTVPDQLILPHPRMHERGFVLMPLADVAPDWVHPVLGQTVVQMLAALPEKALADITPIA